MSANPVARVYAEAVFAIAREGAVVDDWAQELQGFLALVRREPEINLFLMSPVLDPAEKTEHLRRALEGNLSDSVADFLCLLVAKRRFALLPDVVDAYRAMADEHAGRARVSVRSATALAEPLSAEIASALKSALGKDIVLEAEVEPRIMGGAIVSIGDRVYDGSIRGRLRAFRQQIMRSAGYEDQG